MIIFYFLSLFFLGKKRLTFEIYFLSKFSYVKVYVGSVKPVYNSHPWDPIIVAVVSGGPCSEVTYAI